MQTVIPAIITLGVVVPLIVDAVVDQTGEILSPEVRAALVAIGGAVAALAALVSRIMAIPAVEAFLRKHAASQWLAAEPTPVPPVDVEPLALPHLGGEDEVAPYQPRHFVGLSDDDSFSDVADEEEVRRMRRRGGGML